MREECDGAILFQFIIFLHNNISAPLKNRGYFSMKLIYLSSFNLKTWGICE
jgi:hypothetical protein